MTSSSIAALLGTMVVLSAVPGPSDVAVVARSITSGFANAMAMVAGIIIADFLLILLAIYSLGALADSMHAVFVAAQYICAAYLIWLGISSIKKQAEPLEINQPVGNSKASGFTTGFLITLGDPKAIFFYMGLFPAFVNLAGISTTDTLIIMIVATIAIGGVKSTYAYLAEQSKNLFANPAAKRALNCTAGVLLILTGVFLLLRNVTNAA